MDSQVEASTVSAGSFFAESRLLVPDYQRNYRWTPDVQVQDFWRDLSGAIGGSDYFLGLVILSRGEEDRERRQEIVDGQQRLVTVTILANLLRLSAMQLGRRLVAESIRSDFLYSIDFETEELLPRILMTNIEDREDLASLLGATSESEVVLRPGSAIHDAHAFLAGQLTQDISSNDNPALRVGQWAEFIRKRLSFAVFVHPNRGAAFRVYEVINTRGKILTPTELIKSYLIGNSDEASRGETADRWSAIEEQLREVNALDQLTTFVRHVVSLDLGYVIPRELYQKVSSNYPGSNGVEQLLERLETHLSVYVHMIDPGSDIESSEFRTRLFILLETLSLARFRPIFLAASVSAAPDVLMGQALELLVPGTLIARFSTGSIEAQFARAARRVHQEGDWAKELNRLRELNPSREEFQQGLARSINKSQALVIRSTYLGRERLPELIGHPHQVRPRNGDQWQGFDADAYRAVGGHVGNWVLLATERRPQNSRTPEMVKTRILPNLLAEEHLLPNDIDDWTPDRVRFETIEVASQVAELWYGAN